MANSNVSDWDEIEADPEFSSFPRETQLGLFNDWEKKFNRTLLEDADLDKVKPEGLNRFAATNAIRRRKLSGEDVSDPNTAVKSWSEQKQAEAKLAQQTLKDYADVEDKKFRLDDARSMPGVDEFGRASPEWDKGVQEASKSLEAAEAKLAPEVRAQAQAASEALKGKRKIATLNGNIYTDPALVLNKEEFRQQVLDSDASPEAKALKLASFQSERKRFANEALRTLRVVGESPIPGAQDFPSWEASQPKEVYRLPPEDKALQYLREMQKRGDIRKLTSAIGTGILQGGVDIATQAVGTAAMLTGDEETSKVAAELSRASGDIGAAQGLEGDMQATGGTFAGGLSRLGTNMAPMLLPGGAVGGIARMAGAGAGAATAAAVGASALTAGAQTAGSQFGEVYDHLRQQGSTHEQAFGVSRNAAILSGAVTTALTALGGATGVESMLRQGGKELVKSRLKAALKAVPGGAAAEIAEELPDEYVSQLVSAFAKDPTASVSQVTDEFAANAPDLILQIAALGGAGSGVGRFKETTTDPTKAGQPAPADDFAQRAAMEGATEYRAPEEAAARADMRSAAEEEVKKGIPVEVEGVVIATINPESGWTPEDVLDFANSPEDMATLARNKIITLPEVVAPIEGVDLAITEEMNARLAAGKAAGSAGQTLAELERQKAETEALKAEAREAGVNIDLPPDEAFEEVLRAREKASRDAEIRLEQMKAQEEEAAARETGTRRQAAETLGVRPPQEVDISEGAARNADIIRQARARMAGTEQGPRIGFLQSPAVTTATETPSSTANAAGGRQGVQTEPAEGSIPAVTEDIVSTSDTPSTPVSPQGEAPTTATEGQPMPGGSSEWSPTPGQPATANINGQKVVGTVGPSTGKGLVSFQYEWNGKPQKATVRPDRLSSPVASLTDPPRYQYTQEQNTRKMAKHFPSAPGVHANHDFRKSFASMAKDKSLNRIYQKIAEVLSKMPAFANVDLHVVADENQAYAGEYSFDNGKASIGVNLRQVGRGRVDALGTLLHEALHHVTLAKVRDPQGTWENEVLDKLDTIRGKVLEFAKSQGLDQRLDYELGTVEEFITAVFTRPDFQNFLASIPDSFSTGVGVGKFRSVLSEVFRLITEFLSGEPVARGSTMEQSMTTILAMFETPFRAVETGKLEALNAVQSPAGYRTPTDMLAEAAQRAKGEAVGTKPQRLASMFKPQAKRPATGERKLLDMPTRSVLTDAYREAVRGSSTQMAPLSTVYAQARLLQPGLTPETFLAQVQEGYDNGTLLLEGAGSQQEAAQSSLSLPGTPVGTAVRMMPAPQGTLKSKADDMDAEYMAAVESGDVAKQQAMVNAAAKAAVQPFSTETKRTGFTNHTKVRLGSREVSVFRDPENGYWYFADKGGLGDVIAMGKQAAIKAAIERLEEESGGAQPSTEVLFRDWRKDTTITLPGFYLRFGDLPKGGKSVKGHEPGLYEKGVSVLKAWRSPDGVYVISSVGAETGASDMVAGMEGRSIYIAYGEDTGEVGSDGEPLLKNVVLTELVMNNRVVVDDPSYIDQPITNNISEAKEWETISPAPDPLAAADPVTRDKQGNVIPPPQRFNPKSNSTLYSKADDGEPPIIDIGGEAEPADGKGKQLYQKNPTAIGDTYISPADITLQEKKTQQETLDAARKIIGEEIAKNPNNTLAGRRAALNRFRLDTSIPPEVRAVGTGVIAQQADRMANLSEGTDQLLLDEMADEAAKLSGIMSSDLEAWRNLKADANLQIDKMAEEAGRTLNIFNVFRRLTPEGFLRRMTRKFNDAVREKVEQNFDVPAGEVEAEIVRLWKMMQEAGATARGESIAAALKAFMPRRVNTRKIIESLFPQAGIRDRMNKGGEALVRSFFQMMAGPRDQKGPLAEFDESIQSALSGMLRKVMEAKGLVAENQSSQATDIDKMVRAISADELRFDKIAAADEAMQKELDSIEDPERRAVLQQAWEEATAKMYTNIASDATVRRALNVELKGMNVDWTKMFDSNQKPTAIRAKAVDGVMAKIETLLTDPSDPTVRANHGMLRGEVEAAFDFIAANKRTEWLAQREAIEARRRVAEHRAAFMEALRNQGVAEQAINRISEKLAGPQRGKPDQNPVSALVGEHMKAPVADFVDKLVALEVDRATAESLDKAASTLRSEVAAAEKLKAAERAVAQLMKSLKPKPRAPREKIEKALKTLFTADTVGALDDQAFFDAFGEAFGMPPLSDEQQTRIKKLIREINSIPKGPARLDKQQDLDEELALWKGIAARDVLLSAWYANILSGFSTQGMGLLGNAFNFVPRSLFLMATNPRSAKAYLKGAFGEGLSTGLKEAAAAMKGRGLYKVSKHGDKSIIGALELLRKKGPSTLSEWIAYISSAGTEMRRVFRIMQAIDALAWNTAREGHAYLAAHRALLEQEKESGTKRSPEEFSRAFIDSLGGDVAQIEEDLRAARQALIDAGQVPSILTVDRMAREARNLRRAASGVKASNRFADRIVLQLDPEGSGKFISSLIDVFQKKRILGLPVGQLLIPFNRIVSNLFEQSLDYTPVGLVRAILGGHLSDAEIGWDGVKFKEGSQLFDQMERRERGMAAVTGMAAAAAIYALANAYKDEPDEDVPFMVYGWGPESKNKRAQMPKGWVPYSVKWGDTYIKFSEMPFGMMFAAAGSAMDAMRYKGMDKKTSTQRLAYILKTAAKGFLNQGVMSSLDTALETLMFDASEKKMADIPVNVVKGLMPAQGMLRDISTIMDPTKVSDGSLTSMLLRDIPFAKSWGTKPDLNVFGEPIKLDGYPITRRIVTHREPHAVADYLGRNELSIPGMEQTIEIGKYLPDKAKDRIQARAVELGAMENGLFTPEQNYAFKKRAGELTKAAVQEIMKKTPKVANDEQRKQVQDNINKAVGIARNRAMLEAVPVK